MIYPNAGAEEWAEKHSLPIVDYLCPKCRETFKTDIPFIMKDLVGLESRKHECGPNYMTAAMRPRSTEDIKWFDKLI